MKKSYIYDDRANVLMQYDANDMPYFYTTDRPGTVRLVVDADGDVNNTYNYSPLGEMFASECNETVYNPFKFAGQWFDDEINQYYLRARQYDPYIGDANWQSWDYTYYRNGNLNTETFQSSPGSPTSKSHTYNGYQLTGASGTGGSYSLTYDDNGNMIDLPYSGTSELVYNWDGRLRSGQLGDDSISLRLDTTRPVTGYGSSQATARHRRAVSIL